MAARLAIVIAYAASVPEVLYLGYDLTEAQDAYGSADAEKFQFAELYRTPLATRRRRLIPSEKPEEKPAAPKESKSKPADRPKDENKGKGKGKKADKKADQSAEKAESSKKPGDSAKEEKSKVPESGTDEEQFD